MGVKPTSSLDDVIRVLVAQEAGVAVRKALAEAVSPRLLSVKQTSVLLNLSVREVHNMLASKQLPSVAHGRRRLLDIRDLERWIARNKDTR